MDESERTAALKRLQDDYLRGALGAEEYARLREQVMSGQVPEAQDPYWSSARPASTPPPPPLLAGYGPGVVTETHYASWGRRAAALILDAIILTASFIPTGIWAISTEDPSTGEISDASAVVLGFQILLLPSVYAWLMLGAWGQTLGKMALGIVVRRGEDGGKIGFLRALGRVASVLLLGIVTLPLLLSYLWPLWDSRNQTLQDKMANTIVVKT